MIIKLKHLKMKSVFLEKNLAYWLFLMQRILLSFPWILDAAILLNCFTSCFILAVDLKTDGNRIGVHFFFSIKCVKSLQRNSNTSCLDIIWYWIKLSLSSSDSKWRRITVIKMVFRFDKYSYIKMIFTTLQAVCRR